MALAAAAATLGIGCAAAAGSIDPVGIVAWTAIGAVFCAQLPLFCGVFDPTGGSTPMLSAAGVINPGSGGFVVLPAAPMGLLLAAAAGSVDAVGIQKWSNIATTVVNWLGSYGSYGPAGLIGYAVVPPAPQPGPVTGVGLVQFTNELIGPDLATAAGILPTDTVGVAKWTAIGAVIITAIKAFGQIAPVSMVNTAPVGPVAGAGVFT
jgi:hypothetical protein